MSANRLSALLVISLTFLDCSHVHFTVLIYLLLCLGEKKLSCFIISYYNKRDYVLSQLPHLLGGFVTKNDWPLKLTQMHLIN